jgi:hypothetical protein
LLHQVCLCVLAALWCSECWLTGSTPNHQLLSRVDHDDCRQQICGLRIPVHDDLLAYVPSSLLFEVYRLMDSPHDPIGRLRSLCLERQEDWRHHMYVAISRCRSMLKLIIQSGTLIWPMPKSGSPSLFSLLPSSTPDPSLSYAQTPFYTGPS